MEIEEVTKKALDELFGEAFSERIEVGKATSELLQEHRNLEEEKSKLSQDIEDRIQEFEILLKKEFREKDRELSQAHKELWLRTCRELDLDPNNKYSIHKSTGIVTMKIERGDERKH